MSDTITRPLTEWRDISRTTIRRRQLARQRKISRIVMSASVITIGFALIVTSVPPMLGSGFQDTMMPGYKSALADAEQTWETIPQSGQKAQVIVRDDWSTSTTKKNTTSNKTTSGTNKYFSQFNASGALTREQNAALIIAIGRKRGFSWHSVTIAVAVAIQESNLYNNACCDHRSHGLFQQQWGMGWGTLAQTLDPVHATNQFYNRLAAIPSRDRRSMIDVAMQIQIPNRYAYTSTWYKYDREGAATSIVRDYIQAHGA